MPPYEFMRSQLSRFFVSNQNTRELLGKILLVVVLAASVILGVRQVMAVSIASQDSWFAMSRAFDFVHYWPAEQVYDKLLFEQHIKFQYPPSGLFILELLHLLGIEGADNYNMVNAGFFMLYGLAFAIFCTQVLGPIKCLALPIPVGPIAFIVAIKYFPAHLAFADGQIQVALGLLFILACWARWHGRAAAAGVLIAIIATIKPQFLVFGALMLWRREWRFLIAFSATTIAALAISIWMYGWRVQVHYFHEVLPFLSQHGECVHGNQSINGLLNRHLSVEPCIDSDPNADPSSPVRSSWFPPYNSLIYLTTTVSSAMILLTAFLVKPKRRDPLSELLGFCFAGILFTMASPIAWIHHYNVLLPAYAVSLTILITNWTEKREWGLICFLVASLILTGIQLTSPYGPTIPSKNLLQTHVFFGACLLVAALLRQLLTKPQAKSLG